MLLFNNHTHTHFSHDAKGSVDDICKVAINSNLSGFAVTDHCDCEYSEDKIMNNNLVSSFLAAENAKTLYSDKLTVLSGIEIGEAISNRTYAENIISSHPWDVILGSVHAVRIKDHEIPFSVIDFSDKSDEFIDIYITRYFEDVLETAETTDFDILTHLTVVLRYIVYKFNRKVNIEKHYPVIIEILKSVIRHDRTLEINTSGYCDGYLMPDTDIIKMYASLGGRRISLGSDSHAPEKLTSGLKETALLLKKEGFTSLTYYARRCPVEYNI